MGQKFAKTSTKQFLLEVLKVVDFSRRVGINQVKFSQAGCLKRQPEAVAAGCCEGGSTGAVDGLPTCGLSSIAAVFLQSSHPKRTR